MTAETEGVREGGGRSEIEVGPAASGGRSALFVTTTDEDGDVEKEIFPPVDLWSPTAQELADFAGSYASEELDTTWKLVVEDGKLAIRHRGLPEEALKPTVAWTFTVDGMNLTFARDAGRRITGFTLDAGRARGIAFRKL